MSSFDEEEFFKQELMDEELAWEEKRHAFDLQQVEEMEMESDALVASIVTEWDEYWAPSSSESWNDHSNEEDIYDKDYDGSYERSSDLEVEERRELEAKIYEEFQNYEDRRLEAIVADFELDTAMNSCNDVRLRYPCNNHARNMNHLTFLRHDFEDKNKRFSDIESHLEQKTHEKHQFLIAGSISKGFPRSQKEHREEALAQLRGEVSFPRSEETHILERLAQLSASNWFALKVRSFKNQIDELKTELHDASLDRDLSDIRLEEFEAAMINGGYDYQV